MQSQDNNRFIDKCTYSSVLNVNFRSVLTNCKKHDAFILFALLSTKLATIGPDPLLTFGLFVELLISGMLNSSSCFS